jgi:hypothetical protein
MRKLVVRLEDFLQNLEAGIPKCTEVQRYQTSDGPMHIFRESQMVKYTLALLRESIAKGEKFNGYYNGGEIYVLDSNGLTVYNNYVDREVAEEVCEELGITLEEI